MIGFNIGVIQSQRVVSTQSSTFIKVDSIPVGTGGNMITIQGNVSGGTGSWVNFSQLGSNNNTESYSNVVNDYVEIHWVGTQWKWYAEKFNTHGIAAVSTDGGPEIDVDCYDPATASPLLKQLLYTSPILSDGPHIARVRVKGVNNGINTTPGTYYIVHDYFEVAVTTVPATGSLYVGGTGAATGNPGTSTLPFASIQEAANVAIAGDVVVIRAGTYRETVTPANSGTATNPITYIKDSSGGDVIISGLNTISTAWTVHDTSGGKAIYKTTFTLPVASFNLTISSNTTLAANQVFKDGNMVIQARWPKANDVQGLFQRTNLRTKAQVSNWTSNTITDSALPNIAGGWTGAKIFITGWFVAQTGNVTGHSGTTINYNSLNGGADFLQYYYLTGKLGALTQANEFHYENGVLYLWQPGGGTPTNIEYKARNWGFDLSNKNNIILKDLDFKGCDINGNANTSNCTLDHNYFEYLNHSFLQEAPGDANGDATANTLYYNARQTGIKLYGSNNLVKNNEFKYAASQGVLVGQSGRIENNRFSWISYEGNYASPIMFYDSADNVKVLNNTISDVGRSGIDYGWVGYDTHYNMDVGYNDLYNFGMLSADGGAIYSARYQDLNGTRVHHNWIHNSLAQHSPVGPALGINAALYYDHATASNTINDHNVMWDNKQCDLHISTNWVGGPTVSRGNAKFYNNTCATMTYVNYVHGYFSYLNISQIYYDIEENNIFLGRNINVLGSKWDNATNGQSPFHTNNCLVGQYDEQNLPDVPPNPQYVGGIANPINVANPDLYFQLSAGSPARGIGSTIAGINDDDTGPKDAGAYAYGVTGWKAGWVPVP